jgi:hypothetical protein
MQPKAAKLDNNAQSSGTGVFSFKNEPNARTRRVSLALSHRKGGENVASKLENHLQIPSSLTWS